MVMTVEEFLAYPVSDAIAELVRGELRVTPPPGGHHGVAVANLLFVLEAYVRPRGLGRAFGDGFGYELLRLPHTVRVPDASFVRAERLPPAGFGPGLFKGAPDLAVEVLSPSDTASDLEEKLDDYTVSGVALIWVIDPIRRTVRVMAPDAPVRWLREGDALDAGHVLPGFACPVSDIFDGIARPA
jgi:Uma2 family endonuclease